MITFLSRSLLPFESLHGLFDRSMRSWMGDLSARDSLLLAPKIDNGIDKVAHRRLAHCLACVVRGLSSPATVTSAFLLSLFGQPWLLCRRVRDVYAFGSPPRFRERVRAFRHRFEHYHTVIISPSGAAKFDIPRMIIRMLCLPFCLLHRSLMKWVSL